MSNIILASSSPRRIEILKTLNVNFDVIPSVCDEQVEKCSPVDTVIKLSKNKALNVEKRINDKKIIIAADTIVYCKGLILGKPKSMDDAFKMLKLLSGTSHEVITGLCIIDCRNNKILSDFEKTTVYFDELSDDDIRSYIATGEPMDKAGAYGIQGMGGLFVKKIEGCYFNVVGLPVNKLYGMLRKMGVNLLKR